MRFFGRRHFASVGRWLLGLVTLATVVAWIIWPLAPLRDAPLRLSEQSRLYAAYHGARLRVWVERCIHGPWGQDSADRETTTLANVPLWIPTAMVCTVWCSALYLREQKCARGGSGGDEEAGHNAKPPTEAPAPPRVSDVVIRRWLRNRIIGKFVLGCLAYLTVTLGAAWLGVLRPGTFASLIPNSRRTSVLVYRGYVGSGDTFNLPEIRAVASGARPTLYEWSLAGVTVQCWPGYRVRGQEYAGYLSVHVSFWVPTVVLGLLWVGMLSLHQRLNRLRRRTMGLCGGCGYNLTGNESGVCPECGTTIIA